MEQEPAQRILIVEYNRILTSHLQRILAQQGYIPIIAESAEKGFALAIEESPDLVIVDAKLPDMDGAELCRKLREYPATASLSILLMRRDSTTSSKMQVIEAGANDHITQPFYPDALMYRIKSLLLSSQATGASLIGAEAHRRIALFGCKGGVGSTTLAVNLAVALNLRGGGRVVLFDANFFFGDVAVHLDIHTDHSVLDLVNNINQLDAAYVNSILTDYRSTLRVLVGPPRPEDAELITPDHIKRLLQEMSRFSDYMILDCPTSYNEQTLTILESADDIMLVTTPEISAIRNASIFMSLAERLRWPLNKIHVVVNRADSNEQIGTKDIERTLKCPVAFTIMNSRQAVVRSLTSGIPLVFDQPNAPLSQQMIQMAEAFLHRTPKKQLMALQQGSSAHLGSNPKLGAGTSPKLEQSRQENGRLPKQPLTGALHHPNGSTNGKPAAPAQSKTTSLWKKLWQRQG